MAPHRESSQLGLVNNKPDSSMQPVAHTDMTAMTISERPEKEHKKIQLSYKTSLKSCLVLRAYRMPTTLGVLSHSIQFRVLYLACNVTGVHCVCMSVILYTQIKCSRSTYLKSYKSVTRLALLLAPTASRCLRRGILFLYWEHCNEQVVAA
jgi:hypothetical protein